MQPIFGANDSIAAHSDRYSSRCSCNLTPKDQLIAAIDFLQCSIPEKHSILENLKEAWAQKQYEDKYFTWYGNSGKEKQKYETAWHWYRDNHIELTTHTPKFIKKDDVLLFLDRTLFSLEEKRFHLEQIKKKFKAQQTAANRKGKRQTNLTLSDDARKLLDQMAEEQRMTKTEIVERLIRDAQVRGIPD